MPIYIYECDKCKRKFEVKQKMTDEKFTNHRDITQGHQGLPDTCEGKVVRLINCPAVIFKGTGWTPTFGGKTGRKIKKIDQALAAMGVEDESQGWETSDDKQSEVKKPRRKKR